MNSSFLYHVFGVKEYHYHATVYKDSAIFLKLKSNTPKKCKCPHCDSENVIKYGKQYRDIHNLPIGGKQTFLSLAIQRYQCKDCEKVYQADIRSPSDGSSPFPAGFVDKMQTKRH